MPKIQSWVVLQPKKIVPASFTFIPEGGGYKSKFGWSARGGVHKWWDINGEGVHQMCRHHTCPDTNTHVHKYIDKHTMQAHTHTPHKNKPNKKSPTSWPGWTPDSDGPQVQEHCQETNQRGQHDVLQLVAADHDVAGWGRTAAEHASTQTNGQTHGRYHRETHEIEQTDEFGTVWQRGNGKWITLTKMCGWHEISEKINI